MASTTDRAVEPAGPAGSTSPFGRRLRRWRSVRGVSQLDVATAAGTTARHLSFVETGRSRPGRDLVLRLCEVLEVPLAERNSLLIAAGLPAAYPQHRLGSGELAAVDGVLSQVLSRHEPFPAWVVRRPFTFLRANRAAEALFPGLVTMTPEQVVDLWFGPGPFRDSVQNWPEVLRAGLAALRRDAITTDDQQAFALLRRAEAAATTGAGLGHRLPSEPVGDSPVVCPIFTVDGQTVRTISVVMSFETAVEVTTSQLRVELMFPADEGAEAFFSAKAAAASGPAAQTATRSGRRSSTS